MNTDFWNNRPTLVTGATGLMGSWLTEKLVDAGARVTALVRDWTPDSQFHTQGLLENVQVVWGQLEDRSFIERVINEGEIVTVIDLAAQAIVPTANRHPYSTFESNVRGTWCLLEACRTVSTVQQIVIASSDKAYGEQSTLPYTENMPLQGKHPYDVSKSCTDLIAQSYAHTYNLPVVISRCGNFYGGGDLNYSRIVPGTIQSVLRKERPVIRSDGSPTRDYIYVEDGAQAYMLLAEVLEKKPELRGEAFNFSNENPMSVLEIATRILTLMESDLKLDVRNEASNEIPNQYLDATKAREVLGWNPTFNLDEGLEHTIAWYRSHHGQ